MILHKTQLTQNGFHDIQAELRELEEVKLPAIIIRVENARNNGDLSENADYQNAKEDQELLETRIAQLKDILQNSTIVKMSHKANVVGMGSQVKVRIKSGKTKREKTLHIVGEFEGNPLEGKISSASPLGEALMNKKTGDKVMVDAPAGKMEYEILEVK